MNNTKNPLYVMRYLTIRCAIEAARIDGISGYIHQDDDGFWYISED